MISDAKSLITGEEGRRNVAYKDSLGNWTNGIGHFYDDEADHADDWWPDVKVDAVFSADFANACNSISAHWAPFKGLDVVRQAYLVSMTFQLGLHKTLGFVHMLSDLAAGQWVLAASAAKASEWHAETPARCERAAGAFESGQWQQIPS